MTDAPETPETPDAQNPDSVPGTEVMFAGEGAGFNALRRVINHNAEILRNFMTQFATDMQTNIALIAVSERETADHIAEFNGRVENLSSRLSNLAGEHARRIDVMVSRIVTLENGGDDIRNRLSSVEGNCSDAIKPQVAAHETAIKKLHVELREGTSGVFPRLEVLENRMRLQSDTLESVSMISSQHQTEIRGLTHRAECLDTAVPPLQSAVKEHYDCFELVDQNINVGEPERDEGSLGDIAVIERERARIEGQISVLTSVVGHRS